MTQVNSDLALKANSSDLAYTLVRTYDVTPIVDVNALGGYSGGLDLRTQPDYPDKVITAIPIACVQKTNWNNNGVASVVNGITLRLSANTNGVMSVSVLYLIHK